MRDIFVLIFWLWCAASFGILVRRVMTTGSLRNRTREAPETAPEDSFEARLRRGPDTDATSPTSASSSHAVLTRVDSLAEALAGIALPNGLVPVVGDRVDPRNMLFSTTGHRAEVIGQGLAEEVERLGYTIEPVDNETIHAEKDGTEIEVRIHPDVERARMRLGIALATLPESSIVVQMRLR